MQSKTLILFNSVKAKRDVEATKEKFEDSRDWFMRLMKEAISITSKCEVKDQGLM